MNSEFSEMINNAAGIDAGGDPIGQDTVMKTPLGVPKTSNGKATVMLPGGKVSITECAEQLYKHLAEKRAVFIRGRVVVTLGKSADGDYILEPIRPSAARSLFEKAAQFYAWRIGRNSEQVLKPSVMPEETARAILDCHVATDILPPISGLTSCPIITELDGQLSIAGKGYHAPTGLLVTKGEKPPEVQPGEAVGALKQLIEEFDFQAPGDYSRALAALITPALKMGGFIRGPVPADVAEADQSQSGKTYRQKLVAAIYGEHVSLLPEKKNGVGSVDEFFMERLVQGRPFIQFDNFRGRLDSPALESFLTCETSFPCRIAGARSIDVDPTRFFISLSSNGVDTTRDFANRSNIIRIRKRDFSRDPLGEIRANQPFYLGCIFAVVQAWHATGKPRTQDTRHSFREWCQILDWIVQNIFKAAPLMDGHQEAQARVSDPVLTFLRSLALEVDRQGRLGEQLIASQLHEIASGAGIEAPGVPRMADEQKAAKIIGSRLGPLFKKNPTLASDHFTIERQTKWIDRQDNKGMTDQKCYVFTKA